jgi:hypothetical protein
MTFMHVFIIKVYELTFIVALFWITFKILCFLLYKPFLILVRYGIITLDDFPFYFDNQEIIWVAIQYDSTQFKCGSQRLKNDKEFVLRIIKEHPRKYPIDWGNLPYKLQNDKEIVIELVKRNGYLLNYLYDDLINDEEIVLKAIENIDYSLKYASIRLRQDKEFILKAVKVNPLSLHYASINLFSGLGLELDNKIINETIKGLGIMHYKSNDEYNDFFECYGKHDLWKFIISEIKFDRNRFLLYHGRWDITKTEILKNIYFKFK